MRQSLPAEPVPLLERDQEVERLRALLRGAQRRDGGVTVVQAAAGMGKSSLLEQARTHASELGLRVLTARATELEHGFPFGVVRQLFERPLLTADDDQRDRWLAGAGALAADVVTGAPTAGSRAPPAGDPAFARQHGLYWLASNISVDSPLALLVDDLQWCDAPSASALAFIARRLDGQSLALIVATRPLDPARTPEAAALVGDLATELLHPSPLTQPAVTALVASRLPGEPDNRFVRACHEVTGGNPFLLGELLGEAAARGIDSTASAAAEVDAIVPRGVANAVLLRLARLAPAATTLARALSALENAAQIGDAARLAALRGTELEEAMGALVSAGIVEAGGTVRFTHPILRTAIYSDLSPASREHLHQAAATILRGRGAPAAQVAAQVMNTAPAGDPIAVALLRDAAGDALALGDATGAAALLSRALKEPPAESERGTIMLELGHALARAGAAEAIAPLAEIAEHGDDPAAVAAAATDLSGMLFFGGRAAEGAAVLRDAQKRLPAGDPATERVALALLGISYTTVAARSEADAAIADRREPARGARGAMPAATLATLAVDEVMYLGSATAASDLAERALAAGLPVEPHHAWTTMVLAVLAVADRLDEAREGVDELLAEARGRGDPLKVATALTHRAFIDIRRGDLISVEADAQEAIELSSDLMGSEFVAVLAVPLAVVAGIARGTSLDSLRRLLDRCSVGDDAAFMARSMVRYSSGLLRAAGGNHEAAIEDLCGCALGHPMFGGENPAFLPWRSAAARSLAQVGRHEEARERAADEVGRARSFGAPRAIGIALHAQALVGPGSERRQRLAEALEVLAPSSARLEHARVVLDVGATFRAAGQRTAAREPLLEALELAALCGARTLERRARGELTAIGIRPRTTARTGADSLTPSERRVAEFAAAGGTNREIAQTLFVTEKTVETHLGRAFRKLDIASRRQLPDVLVQV